MTSINDLLEQLNTQGQGQEKLARPDVWRICFIVPNAARLWRHDGALLRGLRKHGFQVHVIAHDEGVFEQMEMEGIVTCMIPAVDHFLRGVFGAPALYPIIQGHLIEFPPSLIHVEQEPLISLTLLALKLLESEPLVLATLRGLSDPVERVQEYLPALFEHLVEPVQLTYWQFVLERLDMFLTASREELEHTMARVGQREHRKLEVWPGASGYNASHVNPDRSDLPTREQLREMGEVPSEWTHIIGVAGDLEKEQERLVKSVEMLAKKAPSAGWIIATPSESTPWVKSLKKRLKSFERHIVWLEPGELGMPLFYALSDLFYVPRQDERIATVAVEAQAMGVPVVCFDAGLNALYVENYETGYVLAIEGEHDVRDAIDKLVYLIENEEVLSSFSDAAKVRAPRLYSQEQAHDQLMRLYDRLLSRRYM